jgi:hypothetical protein
MADQRNPLQRAVQIAATVKCASIHRALYPIVTYEAFHVNSVYRAASKKIEHFAALI